MNQEQLNRLTPNILMKSKEEIVQFLDNDLVIYNYNVYKNLLEFPYGEGKSIIIPYGLKDYKRIEFLHYLVTNLDITHILENNLSTPHQINNRNKEDYFLELISFKKNIKEVRAKLEDRIIQLNNLQCHIFFNCQICPYAQNGQFQNCPNYQVTPQLKQIFSKILHTIKNEDFIAKSDHEAFYLINPNLSFMNQNPPFIKGFIANKIEKKFILSNEDVYNFSKSMFEKFNNHGYLFNKRDISDFYYDSNNKSYFLLDFNKVHRITNNFERTKDITIKPTNILKGDLPYYNRGRHIDNFDTLTNFFRPKVSPTLNLLNITGGNNG